MKIVILFICLESLFSDRSDKSDLSFKVRLRATRFITEDSNERLKIFEDIRQGYDVRSSVLHGDNVAERAEKIAKGPEDGGYSLMYGYPLVLQEIVRRVIFKILTNNSDFAHFSNKSTSKLDKNYFDRLVL